MACALPFELPTFAAHFFRKIFSNKTLPAFIGMKSFYE